MDYSVGSLSDLITGSVTPNKKKVIKKKVKKTTLLEETPAPEKDSQKDNDLNEKPSKAQKPKAKKRKSMSVEPQEGEAPSPKKVKNDEGARRRIGLQGQAKTEHDPEQLARTVFVGNIPIASDTNCLKKQFSKFGLVDTVRIRGIPVANPKTPKKVAYIKKEFHPERKSLYGYVRFNERDSAVKAAEANGMIYKEHHLRIHLCDSQEKPDESRAIFVGNLNFCAEENDLWNTFEACGPIESVRIVRDSRTGMGRGFGYVNFENSDAVTLALEMENVQIKKREVRISACNLGAAKKNIKNNKEKKNKPGRVKRTREHKKVEDPGEKPTGNSFQGVKFVPKKKNKLNKGLLQKKLKVKQIAPK